jgi:hypothetical protein
MTSIAWAELLRGPLGSRANTGGGKPRPYVPTLPEIARAKAFLDLPITSRDQASWSREACPLSIFDTRP